MNRESIIDRVRKLRNLTASNNLNEATAAARAAERLIQENALEEAELEVSQGVSETVMEDGQSLTDWDQRQCVWQNILLTTLCTAYNCSGVLKRNQGRIGYFAIGRPSDIATLRYQYAFFCLELGRLAHLMAPAGLNRGAGKHWHKSFYLGAVSAISRELQAARAETRAQASSTALAVVDQHQHEAAMLLAKLYPRSRHRAHHSAIDRGAYELGQLAGSNLQAKPGLGPGIRGLLK